MQWIPSIAAALITALGAGVLSRLRLSDRLRHRAAAENDLLLKMEDGAVRRVLKEHVERQVLLLVAEEEELSGWERMDRRWGYAFICLLAPAAALLGRDFDDNLVRALWYALAGAFVLYGLMRVARVSRARQARRLWKQARADPPDREMVPPLTMRAVLAGMWRSIAHPRNSR